MNITECKVNPVENMGRTKGFATMVIDNAVVIRGIRVYEGNNGLSVSFPQRQNSRGEYEDVVRPISKEAYEEVKEVVIASYAEAVEEKNRAAIVGQMVERGRQSYKERTGNDYPRVSSRRSGDSYHVNRNQSHSRNYQDRGNYQRPESETAERGGYYRASRRGR